MTPNSSVSKNLNSLVLEAIDEGLKVLGDESVAHAFYYHVEKRGKVKREEIPQKLEAFHKALTDLFVDGALILERRIAQSLFETLGLEFEQHNGWTLSDYVKQAESCSS